MDKQTMATDELMEYKTRLYEQFGLLGRAVSSPKRLELLDLLCQGERTVEDLASETGLSISNVSQHLSVLKNARLLSSRKDGLYVHYYLADPDVANFWLAFRTLAVNRIAEVREVIRLYFQKDEGFSPIKHDELQQLIKSGNVVVLDVRPEAEYRAGHIPGAYSLPLKELNERLNEIPRDHEVVAYCRGPFCVMALEAVKLLREKGFEARRFEDGIPEWRARGNPVDRS